MLMYSVDASSDTTVSFRGSGVTITLTYPEEARPNATITHKITITAPASIKLQNCTIIIKAPVNSSQVEICSAREANQQDLPKIYNLTGSLPQETDGTMQCFIFVDTSSIDELSTTLYTTLVSDPTFSEMKILYAEMYTNYTSLVAEYNAKVDEYNKLADNYNKTYDDYTALLIEYDTLSGLYNDTYLAYKAKIESYTDLDTSYKSKITQLSDLQRNYNHLNDTTNELRANLTDLQTFYDELNENYTILLNDFDKLSEDFNVTEDRYISETGIDKIVMVIFITAVAILIVFIVYIKNKQKDPYLVIRKETVSMKSDEET